MGLAGVGRVTPMLASLFSIVPAILDLRRVSNRHNPGPSAWRRASHARSVVAGIPGGLYLAQILQPSGPHRPLDREESRKS